MTVPPPVRPSAVPFGAVVLTVLTALGTPALLWPVVSAAPASASVSGQIEPVRPEEGEIVRLYRSALGRDPDAEGYRYWVTRRIEGLALDAVADSFLVGREFERRFGGDDLDPAAFVDRVYRNVLDRPGDADGSAYWQGELARGLDRHHLVLLFSESVELQRRTGTELEALPPFQPEVSPVTAADLPTSWRPGCPVEPEDLRVIELDHVDRMGAHDRGVLVVHQDVADEVVAIFEQLYDARYPITSMRPVDEFIGDDGRANDDASMAADNTSAFNCRAVTGGTRWSRHAFGTAIDINPVTNPYVSGSGSGSGSVTVVLPPSGAAWVDRSAHHPAMIRPGDVVTRAFAAAGWRWGGDFVSLKDYQHFQR